ncbi:hypothetical protein BH11PSE14_BH11PSE14_01060 [soil metagenome]
MNAPTSPISASEMERTRIQAFKELRGLLSEVLASAVADEEVPEAFKSIGNWEKLITQTEQRLAEGWRERFEADPRAKRERPQGKVLDLLPEDEQLQQVLSERFVNEVSYNVRDPLDQLDRQLAALSGDGFDDRSANPLSPTAWAEGLRGGMRLMNCTQAERDWLMERLVELLTARIGTFYSGLTARLQASGVVAPSRYGRSGGGMARASGDSVGGGAGGGNSQEYRPDLVDQVTQSLPTGDGAPPPVDEGSAALDRLFGLLSARRGPEQVAGQWPAYGMPAGYGPQPGYMPMPGGGAPGYPPGFVPMQGVPMAPGFMPSGMPGGGMPGGGFAMPGGGMPATEGGAPAAPVAPWSQADIFSILSLMQANQSPAAGAAVALSRLQEAMSATASQLGLSGAAPQAMPAPAQDLLELVSMLFEALLDGRRLDKKARSQLSSLVVPYVRVAMLDRRMFMQSSHPARRVLNQLVEAFETAGPDVPQYATLRELGFTTIERILSEFSDELTLFESLEKDLAKEIDICHRRADLSERRAAKAQDGKERRQAARESVAEWLKSAIGSRRLPPALLDFLCGRWQHHQNILLLREGEAGEGVQANRSLLRDLLKAFDKCDLGDTAALRGRLDQVVHSSGHSVESVDGLLAELSLAFSVQADEERNANQVAAAEAAQAAALASLATAPAADGDSADEAVPVVTGQAEPLPADMVQRYVDAPIGAWLDFVGDDGRVSSARISWTSPISGKRILSNRRGQRILVASPQELAAMELEGRLRPRQAGAAFDLALNAIADKLEAAAGTPG